MPTRKKGTKPVRDVAKRTNRGRKAYIVPTERNATGFVAGESFLERNHLLLLSLQVGLRRVSDQAVCIDLENETLVPSRAELPKKAGRKVTSYTADSEYERADGQIGVCESKPSAFLEKHAEKHARAEKILSKYGKPFMTLTEEGFTPVFISNLENLKKALSSAQEQHAAEAGQKISRALLRQDRWLTHELKQWAALTSADIFFGLAYGVLRADLTQPLFSATACVEAAHGTLDHLMFVEL
ncbi:hypothetical protein RTH74_15265 [Pseudomonas sp. zfem001]|uniref:hypothetical protein n=1 Tax=Pseudomonas sp. zfem001 TaxID=3078196 RepID=UPI002928942E|nr:hypothetical protein [Pseudomonas sp. zfem001]MDU9408962.1 hypothetical protein [Pseudomonas sp. zfem001]